MTHEKYDLDPVLRYLKEHAPSVPEQSTSQRHALFSRLKELREQSFRKTLIWVPVTMSSLVVVLFVAMNVIQSGRDSIERVVRSEETLEQFLEDSFSSVWELQED